MGESDRIVQVIFFKDTAKLNEALDSFNITNFKGKKIPVKLHMGEAKNKYFTKPAFVRLVVDKLNDVGASPFLFDTTVAYPSLRRKKQGYARVAKLHGFTEKAVN